MIIKNFINLIKASIFQFLGMAILISFLLFFLNLLFATSYSISNFSTDVRERLGVYFYLQDPDQVYDSDKLYANIIDLRSELESGGLEVEYYSKDDALRLLEDRMPEIIENFDEYGIDNPLPPTLYVLFTNSSEYEYMKDTISDYSDIIVNIDDVIQGQSFEDQQHRISNIINLTNFTVYFSYFLIVVLLIIIITFLMFIIKSSFYTFYKQIQVEKLLGAHYLQIKSPFFIKIFSVLMLGMIFMIFYSIFLINYLDLYLYNLFELSFAEYIYNYNLYIVYFLFFQFIIIFFISIFISNFFLNRLIKRI